jgi:hypothetical protein
MKQGRDKADWSIASNVLAMIANTARDPKRQRAPFQAADFNPFAPRKKPGGVRLAKGNRATLRAMFNAAGGGS